MVGPSALGDLSEGVLDRRHAVLGRRSAEQRARLLSQPATLLDHVEPEHAHSRSDQQADDQLANESKADDGGGLPSLGSDCRIPCIAIAPTVAKAAWSGGTPAGTGATG